jgi:transcription factor STE12
LFHRALPNVKRRHRRIHEQQQNGEAIDAFSDEELEADQDHLVSLEEESPESEHAFLTGAAGLMSGGGGGGHHSHHNSLSGVNMNMMQHHGGLVEMSPAMAAGGAGMNGTSMGPPQMVAAQNF